MKLKQFRITNFRSIVDTGWVPFSADGITVLVGQNESGKTSVLDALNFALSTEVPTVDDVRIGAPKPTVELKIELPTEEIDSHIESSSLAEFEVSALKEFLGASNQTIELLCDWDWDQEELDGQCSTVNDELNELLRKHFDLKASAEQAGNRSEASDEGKPEQDTQPAGGNPELDDLGPKIWRMLPLGVLFNERRGQLPNQVDIDDQGRPTGPGARAAMNFLEIAEINLPSLISQDRRAIENTLNRANTRVSADFTSFWSQTIGKSSKLSLKCEIDHYESTAEGKAGKPHLVFWICDGDTQLYPKQRSQGVRWFVSFYLQLKASEKAKQRRVFLLDEPGANLHSRAQGDVLKLINQLGMDLTTVVYSTHSPQMVEYEKLFRVRAVQRDGEKEDSPTLVMDAQHLGAASTDTLSPVLSAMGVDLSHHNVIKKQDNVILEEMSAHYYLRSFWKLLDEKQEAHFIAATGVNKVELLANMFVGWGLDFVVAIDDDKQGREAYKSLKRELFGGDEKAAKRRLMKFDFPAIEDVFSQEDFAEFVLGDKSIHIAGTNAEYIKAERRSKPVLAFGFYLKVEEGTLKMRDLSKASQANIKKLVGDIASLLR